MSREAICAGATGFPGMVRPIIGRTID